jgi:hypothetical protein
MLCYVYVMLRVCYVMLCYVYVTTNVKNAHSGHECIRRHEVSKTLLANIPHMVTVKVKVTLEQVTKAQSGSRALLFL